ncbi:Leukocyte cysteine proteinase inhibitor 1, partial [Egretta garzetta]
VITGGFSETRPATPEVQHIVDEVKQDFQERTNMTFSMFKAISYRSQVVSGTNYIIKVQASETEYFHLKVFQSLPQEDQGPKLVSFQTGKTKDDPLIPF